MNIKRFNGNDFPGDKWVRDILSRVNEIIDYLKRKVGFDRLSDEVTEVLTPLTSVGTDGQVLTSTGATAGWEDLPVASASQSGIVKGGTVPGNTSGIATQAGYIGEVISASLSNVSATSAAVHNAASITLNKGVYIVTGKVWGDFSSNPTSYTELAVSISTTTATLDAGTRVSSPGDTPGSAKMTGTTAILEITNDSTPVYLTFRMIYSGGSGAKSNASGGMFKAVRVG